MAPDVNCDRTEPASVPRPRLIVLPVTVPSDWPSTSTKEILDALYPIVFRLARLLPTTLNPIALALRPERPVVNVFKLMLGKLLCSLMCRWRPRRSIPRWTEEWFECSRCLRGCPLALQGC